MRMSSWTPQLQILRLLRFDFSILIMYATFLFFSFLFFFFSLFFRFIRHRSGWTLTVVVKHGTNILCTCINHRPLAYLRTCSLYSWLHTTLMKSESIRAILSSPLCTVILLLSRQRRRTCHHGLLRVVIHDRINQIPVVLSAFNTAAQCFDMISWTLLYCNGSLAIYKSLQCGSGQTTTLQFPRASLDLSWCFFLFV